MSVLYVYALTDAAVPSFTLEGHDVSSVDLDGIHAVGEPLAQSPDVSEAALRRQHAVVLEIAARTGAVLPARFGSVVALEELRRIVAMRRAVIAEALDLVRGREQMTIRVRRPHVEAPPLREAAPPASSGTAYLHARRAAAAPAADADADTLTRAVQDLVAATRVAHGSDGVTVYHLIEAGAAPRYRERIAAAAPALTAAPQVSGPWPAFAFVPDLLA